jgi:pilus assembly protein CpaB
MTIRSVLLLLSALVVAAGTAFAVKAWLNAERAALAGLETEEPVIIEAETVEILTARHDLSPGDFLTDESVAWAAWPEEAVHDSHITRGELTEDDMNGAVARFAVVAGEPLTAHRIVHPGDRGFLAAVLEHGFRAVSVPVDATTGISGFVFPNDRVDVVMTMDVRSKDEEGEAQKRYFSQTVLRAIRVLAIDQTVEAVDGETDVAKTVTLEVTEKEAERVALALEMGRLSLSLNALAKADPMTEMTIADGVAAAETAPGASDPNRTHGRSYTLDMDVYNMLGDPRLFPAGGGRAGPEVVVMRGEEAETKVFDR